MCHVPIQPRRSVQMKTVKQAMARDVLAMLQVQESLESLESWNVERRQMHEEIYLIITIDHH